MLLGNALVSETGKHCVWSEYSNLAVVVVCMCICLFYCLVNVVSKKNNTSNFSYFLKILYEIQL